MIDYRYTFIIITLFVAIIGGYSCQKNSPVSLNEPQEEETPEEVSFPVKEHPIGIQHIDGEPEFYDKQHGEIFVPRGVNYFEIVSTDTGLEDRFFGVNIFDEVQVAEDFEELKNSGFNVVRIFLDSCSNGPGCIGKPGEKGLNGNYLDNIVRTMELAKEAGIYLLLTSNDLPSQGGYVQIADSAISEQFGAYRNVQFLSEKGIQAFQGYWEDLLFGLAVREAPFEVVLSWSLLNEQWYISNEPPFSLSTGTVITANGKSYNMSNRNDKKRMAVEGMIYFVDSIREVIDRYDPNALVTMGFFVPDYPNPIRQGDFRYVETEPLLYEADLDFFDFHAYPGEDEIEKIAENFGVTNYEQKPVIMGEVGAFIDRYPELSDAVETIQGWIAQSCREGFNGWLYWGLYRAPMAIGDATWGLKDGEQEMMRGLSQSKVPDLCDDSLLPPENIALGKTATASQSLPDAPPKDAIDGDVDTGWGSGADAPQWIEIDLGALAVIEGIRLFVDQYPAGSTTHKVFGKSDSSGAYQELHIFSGETKFGDILKHEFTTPAEDIRYVRIETATSPSFVSWSEIEIYGAISSNKQL